MKKSVYSIIVAGLALVSVACQKLDEQAVTFGANELTVTASIVNFDGTKVKYDFTTTGDPKSGIKSSWTDGDVIFGFDEDGNTFSFPFLEIDSQTGDAVFDASFATGLSGKLYAIYYPGMSTSDINNRTLAVDLSTQSGSLEDGKSPVIMCATGEIKDNTVNFAFTNQTAIVGIYKMQVYNDGKPIGENNRITSVILKGARTDGKIKVKDGVLTLEAGNGNLVDLTASVDMTTDEDGYVSVDVSKNRVPYFVVIPQNEASLSIQAISNDESFNTNASITGKLAAGHYYYLGKKIYGGTVATIGSTNYATISEAFAAATDGQTITLVADCTVDKHTLVTGKTITLDLNDCTLTHDGSKCIGAGNDGKLIITDNGGDETKGEIHQSSISTSTFTVSEGTLTIAGGKITKESCPDDPADNNTIIVSGGKLEVQGGKIINDTESTISVSGTGNVTVTGGEIAANNNDAGNAIYLGKGKGNIRISGGYIHSKKVTINITGDSQHSLNLSGDCEVISESSNTLYSNSTATNPNSTVTVTGGKYRAKDLSTGVFTIKADAGVKTLYVVSGCIYYGSDIISSRLATGYTTVDNDDPETRGDYTKKVAPKVTITVGDGNPQFCANVEAAVDAANKADQACTITLNADYQMTSNAIVMNSNGVTLDLNNRTLKQYGTTGRIKPTSSGKLTITDSGTNGKITQTSKQSSTFALDGGELIIEKGTITKPSSSEGNTITVQSGGKLTVKGGEITNDATGSATISLNSNSNAVVDIYGGTIKSTGFRAFTVNSGTLNVNGGNIFTEATAQSSIYIAGGSVTIDEKDGNNVTITAPNITVSNDNALIPVVYAKGGSLILKSGTIGNNTNPTAAGNITAVVVENGEFTMEGGYLYARRHAIIFNGSNSSNPNNTEIKNGHLETTVGGWSLIRFQDRATNKLTISNGGFTVKPDGSSNGVIFAGATTGKAVPTAGNIIIKGGYFSKTPIVNNVTVNSPYSVKSEGDYKYEYDSKTYGFKVE